MVEAKRRRPSERSQSSYDIAKKEGSRIEVYKTLCFGMGPAFSELHVELVATPGLPALLGTSHVFCRRNLRLQILMVLGKTEEAAYREHVSDCKKLAILSGIRAVPKTGCQHCDIAMLRDVLCLRALSAEAVLSICAIAVKCK